MSVTYAGVSLTVEVGFASDPTTAIGSTTWTDISAYVRDLEMQRGRQHELDKFEAGTCRLKLNNRDRRFDPTFTTGAYYPNVLPMRRLRVRATYNAVTYDLFSGFVEAWPQEYPTPLVNAGDAIVNVRAVDGFKVLANSPLASGVYYTEVSADTPFLWYRLGEERGTIAADASGNRRDGTYIGAPILGAQGLAYETDTAVEFDDQLGRAVVSPQLDTFPATGVIDVEFWMRTGAQPASTIAFWVLAHFDDTNTIDSHFLIMYLQTDGTLKAGLDVLFGAQAVVTSSVPVNDNNLHLVQLHMPANGGAPSIYIDSTDRSTSAAAGTAFEIYKPTLQIHSSTVAGPACVIDEFALYTATLSSGRRTAHYNAGTQPWAGDTSGTRAGRILDAIAWPAADRTIDTGKSTLQATRLGGQALDYLQNVESSESGGLFMTGAGKVRFRDRHSVLTVAASTTSQATLGDSGAELGYTDLVLNYDDTLIRNKVTAQRDGGIPQIASDATSQTRYLQRGAEYTGLLIQTDVEARDKANWVLSHYKDPDLRVESITVAPNKTPATLYPQALGREIGDRITVKRRPPGGGTITKDVLIEGVEHRATPAGTWETTWRLSPAETQQFWILGTSQLGTDTRLAY